MSMNIKQIKPRLKGKSDKYSWQLYQYMVKNRIGKLPTVIFANKLSKDSERAEFYPADIRRNNIWIATNIESCQVESNGKKGTARWIHGNGLGTILSDSREKYTTFANPWIQEYEDITDWFWSEYIKYGRCLLDPEHIGWWQGDDNRFTYINKNSRRCNWCGRWQYRTIKKTVTIKRSDSWVLNTK